MGPLATMVGKEVKDYFISPIAYIVIAVFLLVAGWLFFTTFFLFNQAEMRNFFNLLPMTFSFVIPAVTMRLFSEELSVGSFEVMYTLPVRFSEIVVGKFLAAVLFMAAVLAPTAAYPLVIALLGDLDWGPVLGGYAGALLLAAAFSAVGLFASALTRNQIIAFIVGALICFTLSVIDKMLFFFPDRFLGVLAYLGAETHFDNIAKGVIDSRDLLYFCSVVFIALYAATLAMQDRK